MIAVIVDADWLGAISQCSQPWASILQNIFRGALRDINASLPALSAGTDGLILFTDAAVN